MEHYKAAMLLSGAGDALGYRNQLWEYNESGPAIHKVSVRQQEKDTVRYPNSENGRFQGP